MLTSVMLKLKKPSLVSAGTRLGTSWRKVTKAAE